MEKIPFQITDKVIKLKKLQAYEVMLASLVKLFKEIQNDNFKVLDFRTNLRVFINMLMADVSGYEDFFIRLLSSLEIPSPVVSHSLNTAIFSLILSQYTKVDKNMKVKIITAALFHDIGKINFNEKIKTLYIYRNEDLNDVPKYHPVWGERLCLYHLKMLPEVARLVLNHHEQNDGSGFPRNLKEEDLTIPDHIIITANIMDNILQKTNYDSMDTLGKALNSLIETDKYKFHPAIISALNEIFNLKNEERKFRRYRLSLKCSVENMLSNIVNSCEINNISSGGLEILTPDDLNQLAIYRVNSRISPNLMLKEKFCKIVWKKRQGNKFSFGLKFESQSPDIIQKALHELGLEH